MMTDPGINSDSVDARVNSVDEHVSDNADEDIQGNDQPAEQDHGGRTSDGDDDDNSADSGSDVDQSSADDVELAAGVTPVQVKNVFKQYSQGNAADIAARFTNAAQDGPVVKRFDSPGGTVRTLYSSVIVCPVSPRSSTQPPIKQTTQYASLGAIRRYSMVTLYVQSNSRLWRCSMRAARRWRSKHNGMRSGHRSSEFLRRFQYFVGQKSLQAWKQNKTPAGTQCMAANVRRCSPCEVG